MWSLPPPPLAAGSLLVAFSGGLDSSVLLHCIAHDARFNGRVRAVHVHHGLLAEADAWALHCQEQCAAWRIPLEVVRVKVARDGGEGLEAAARHARHTAFAAHMAQGDVLVTAHHRDDQAETFLLRALRGSGIDGLGAMQPWRVFPPGWQWRPLLDLPRAALFDHARRHELTWIEDPSNAQSEQDRNFLRLEVLPLLRQRWPHADAAFAHSARLAGEATRLLIEDDARALASATITDPHTLHVSALHGMPRERRARVLRRWLHELGLPPLPVEGIHHIEHDLLQARPDAEAQFRWRDAVVRRWRDQLHAERQRPALAKDWTAQWHTTRPLTLPTGDTLTLDSPVAWVAPLRITARRGGERLRLPGRAHSHALKKLLQDAGIPPWQRARLPLLRDEHGDLLAAGDLLFSARFDHWLREHGAALRWGAKTDPAR